MKIPLADIQIDDNRQRQDLGDVKALRASMDRHGQINPITVERVEDGFRLIAGERRLRAALLAPAWTEISATFFDDLDSSAKRAIELEENIKRKQLTWPEEVRAYRDYVRLVSSDRTLESIAADFGHASHSTLSQMLSVADAIDENPKLLECATWRSAYDMHRIAVTRKGAGIIERMLSSPSFLDEIEAPTIEQRGSSGIVEVSDGLVHVPLSQIELPQRGPVERADFLEWAPSYSGPRFNLIHVDFPYGLSMDTANLQNSSARWDTIDPRYADSPELFEQLLRCFVKHQEKFITESAHCIFWLAAKNFAWVQKMFTMSGWTTFEMPLIWHKSDNAGIAPDVRRWPRRTYEMALFASRGDRKIIRVKAASISAPTTKDYHLSEKPLAVVRHFLEMICDGESEVFDPSAGSGTALRVAKELGARTVRGLDVDPAHVEYANRALELR